MNQVEQKRKKNKISNVDKQKICDLAKKAKNLNYKI